MNPLLAAALLAAALALPAVPTANAGHVGPCWHEYAEAVLYSIGKSPKDMLFTIGGTVSGCTDDVVCDVIDPCVLP